MNSSLATLAVFLVAAMFLSQAQAESYPSICCYSYTKKPIPKRILKSFQQTHGLCHMPAILFTTHRNKQLCADPNEPWVQDLIVYLSKN